MRVIKHPGSCSRSKSIMESIHTLLEVQQSSFGYQLFQTPQFCVIAIEYFAAVDRDTLYINILLKDHAHVCTLNVNLLNGFKALKCQAFKNARTVSKQISGGHFYIYRCRLTSIGISIIMIRWSRDSRIVIMGVPVPGNEVFILNEDRYVFTHAVTHARYITITYYETNIICNSYYVNAFNS